MPFIPLSLLFIYLFICLFAIYLFIYLFICYLFIYLSVYLLFIYVFICVFVIYLFILKHNNKKNKQCCSAEVLIIRNIKISPTKLKKEWQN